MDIAVFVGDDGQTAELDGPGTIRIYRKNQKGWAVLRETGFFLDKNSGLSALRQEMRKILLFLDECRTFAAGAVAGVPYFELEKAGCSIWELEGEPGQFLDYILEKERMENEQVLTVNKNTVPEPVETSPGCFAISLKEIQSNGSGFTSKQVLRPFLRQNAFQRLEVLCSHIPPWLEVEMENDNYSTGVDKNGPGELKVVITRRCGKRGNE